MKKPKSKEDERRILTCKVEGFPVPRIIWRRNGTELQHRKSVVIRYRKKQSRLIIRKLNAKLKGSYECLAQVGNQTWASKVIDIQTTPVDVSTIECNEKMKMSFCLNGGTCGFEKNMSEVYCICAPSYTGKQCEVKLPSDTSTYLHQPELNSCKLGLSTSYYCKRFLLRQPNSKFG